MAPDHEPPMANKLRSVPFLFVALTVPACGGGDDLDTPVPGLPPAASAPKDLDGQIKVAFEACAVCHGNSGHGDGPGAAALNPKPRTFADVAWQDSVTDEHIQKTIAFGGAAVGKSPMMPAHPQFKDQKDVLAGLVKIVRGFKGK